MNAPRLADICRIHGPRYFAAFGDSLSVSTFAVSSKSTVFMVTDPHLNCTHACRGSRDNLSTSCVSPIFTSASQSLAAAFIVQSRLIDHVVRPNLTLDADFREAAYKKLRRSRPVFVGIRAEVKQNAYYPESNRGDSINGPDAGLFD